MILHLMILMIQMTLLNLMNLMILMTLLNLMILMTLLLQMILMTLHYLMMIPLMNLNQMTLHSLILILMNLILLMNRFRSCDHIWSFSFPCGPMIQSKILLSMNSYRIICVQLQSLMMMEDGVRRVVVHGDCVLILRILHCQICDLILILSSQSIRIQMISCVILRVLLLRVVVGDDVRVVVGLMGGQHGLLMSIRSLSIQMISCVIQSLLLQVVVGDDVRVVVGLMGGQHGLQMSIQSLSIQMISLKLHWSMILIHRKMINRGQH